MQNILFLQNRMLYDLFDENRAIISCMSNWTAFICAIRRSESESEVAMKQIQRPSRSLATEYERQKPVTHLCRELHNFIGFSGHKCEFIINTCNAGAGALK